MIINFPNKQDAGLFAANISRGDTCTNTRPGNFPNDFMHLIIGEFPGFDRCFIKCLMPYVFFLVYRFA